MADLSLALAGKSDCSEYRCFKDCYLIYSNTSGEQQSPAPHEHKISFMLKGAVAREMSDSMAPYSKQRGNLEQG